MLKSAGFQNFTTVPNAKWEFASGLNVIIGENGLGKSHVLKAIYALLKVQADRSTEFTKAALEKALAEKLVTVLRPESLGRLVKRKQGRQRCELSLTMRDSALSSTLSFATQAASAVQLRKTPSRQLDKSPVYLPTRELVTLSPWFVPLYDNYHLEFEETWRDTVSLLGSPALKGPREKNVAQLVRPLEEAMGGNVVVDTKTGRFYLQVSGEGKMEITLVAEGLRKLAMLARLISTGVLLDQGYLFWDEPETNLNPKLIQKVATSILHLCKQGIQVFIATHSLFLLRELEIQASQDLFSSVEQRFFAISKSDDGTVLEQGDRVDDLKTLVLLDEELRQSDRFMELNS